DRERVAAEVNGVEAVIHDELGPHRVVHAGSEDIRPRREQPPQALAWVFGTRCRNLEPMWEQRCVDQIHQALLECELRSLTLRMGGSTRSRDRSCTDRGIRTRAPKAPS